MYQQVFKRSFDLIFALLGLILAFPLLLILCGLIYLETRENPIFSQRRPGLHEKIFRLYKLKTMNSRTDATGALLPDAERLTRTGAFIRKTSLDEIPQLYNVLKGDMSFIGPRPLLIRYLPFYTEQERIRHSVRPGITGLAQVSGRNTLGWDARLQKDMEYVEGLSLGMDLRVVARTILKVLKRSDIVILPTTQMIDLDEYRS
ncbi:sugar transferase [Robiginitalea sp. M366]|uniref:sugar transferase n=1 Tax=Robiginitalea aestuariiviva TaxID=3036903 RepID=UPI00240DEB29|nr:sugar transferase [Robiginitalea aestuariiviva]MDG1572724.1 sugar transferase [Robiginitalea aestuariiviva]